MLIPTSDTTKTITDMREDALKLLADVEEKGMLYVFHHSSPKAVMLSIDEFRRMQELIEDRIDEDDALRLSKEKRGKGIPLSKILSKYARKSRV